MKGNVFSQWLKEFCALVFTQTVQAFILAIILTLVVMSLVSQNSAGYTNVTSNQAAGVLAIIALTTISKMEALIKKLFGLESSITDTSMKGGRGGVIGTIAAMKMTKKVLDNAPKIATGVRNFSNSNKQLKNAELDKINKEDKLRRRFLEKHANNESDSSSSKGNSTSSSNGGSASTSKGNPVLESAQAAFDKMVAEGFKPGDSEYDNALKNLNKEKEKQAKKVAASNASTSDKKITPKDRYQFEDDLEKIGKDYQDEIQKIKKERRKAVRSIASGLTESAGSLYGGATGAIVGLATGDDILKTTGIGMGVGDTIGKKIIDIPADIHEHRKDVEDLNNKYKSYKKNIDESRKELDKLRDQMKKFNAGDI